MTTTICVIVTGSPRSEDTGLAYPVVLASVDSSNREEPPSQCVLGRPSIGGLHFSPFVLATHAHTRGTLSLFAETD